MARARRPTELTVRPLDQAEVPEVVRAMPGTGEARASLVGELGEMAEIDPLHVLGAFERDGDPVALAWGAFTAQGYHVLGVKVRRAAVRDAAVRAVVGYLKGRFAGGRVELRTENGRRDAWLRAALESADLDAEPDQVLYERELHGFRPPRSDPFEYRAYAAVGRAAAAGLLGRIRSDVFADASTLDAVDLMDAMLYSASAAREPGVAPLAAWQVAFLDGEPAGLVFPLLPEGSESGTLLYVGLVPEQRGRGLGRVLHAQGLALLKGAGARSYEDATMAANTPMRRTFERNGCRASGAFRVYSWAAVPAPERLPDLAALVDLLAERGQPHTVEAPEGVIARLRFAHAEADVGIEWSRDARTITVVRAYEFRVRASQRDQVAQAVCALDRELELGGFTFDADARTVAFRATLPTDRDGAVAGETLMRVLREAVVTSERWERRWREFAEGSEAAVPRASLLRVRVGQAA